MKAIKLSIVIPVYNVEKYLSQCVQSVVAQNQEDIEIILVDDGSLDSSPVLCDDWARKISNIKVIHQNNRGLSTARNNGLEISNGTYIWFIDSDDWILPNAISRIMVLVSLYPTIDVFSSFMRVFCENENRYEEPYSLKNGKIYSGKTYLWGNPAIGAAQRFIYRKKFLLDNNLKFYPGILHEDGVWCYSIFYLAPKIYFIDGPIYVYRKRTEGSIMSNIKIQSAYDLIKGYRVLKEFMYTNVEGKDYLRFNNKIYDMILDSYAFCDNILKTDDFMEFEKKERKYILEQSFALLKHYPLSLKIWITILKPYKIATYLRTKKILLLTVKKIVKFIFNIKVLSNN